MLRTEAMQVDTTAQSRCFGCGITLEQLRVQWNVTELPLQRQRASKEATWKSRVVYLPDSQSTVMNPLLVLSLRPQPTIDYIRR